MSTLSVRECLSFGWKTFASRPWLFVQAGVLLFLVNMALSMIQSFFELGGEQMGPEIAIIALIISTIVGMAVSFVISMGETSFFLRAHDDTGSASIRDLWHPHPLWKYLGMSFLLGLIVLVGFVLLIVPGVILAIMFLFAGYLVIEKELGPVEALKESAALTKGNRWKLFGLCLALIGINILGALALVVGLLVSIPVSALAMTHAYRKLSNANVGVVEEVEIEAAAIA